MHGYICAQDNGEHSEPGKIEIIRSQKFMLSEVRLKFLKKKEIILGPQFCRILVLGPHFWWSGGPGPLGPRAPGPPGSAPA